MKKKNIGLIILIVKFQMVTMLEKVDRTVEEKKFLKLI